MIDHKSCAVCGCISEFDQFGDKACGCDSCKATGCINYYESDADDLP